MRHKQHREEATPDQGEYALWGAVMIEAVNGIYSLAHDQLPVGICIGAADKGYTIIRRFHEEVTWFWSDERRPLEEGATFLSLCDLFGFDPEAVRDRVREIVEGGESRNSENRGRERLWVSPGCREVGQGELWRD